MQRKILLAFGLLWGYGVWAKPAPAAAKDVMAMALENLEGAHSLRMEFKTKTYWEAMGEWQTEKGVLLVSGEDKFRLTLPASHWISDGETFWQYSLENKQVVIEAFGASGKRQTPADVLLQFMSCKPLAMEKIKEGKKELYRVTLDPAKSLDQYDSLTVYLETGSLMPKKVTTRDEAHNRIEYHLTRITKKPKFKKGDFSFEVPKGVEVLDMRE